jgi:hypothetical protein
MDETRKRAASLNTSLNLSFPVHTGHDRTCPVASIRTYSDALRRPHAASNQTHRQSCCPLPNAVTVHRRGGFICSRKSTTKKCTELSGYCSYVLYLCKSLFLSCKYCLTSKTFYPSTLYYFTQRVISYHLIKSRFKSISPK